MKRLCHSRAQGHGLEHEQAQRKYHLIGPLEISQACEASLPVAGTSCLAAVGEEAETAGKQAGPEGVAERGCFWLVCRLLAGLGQEVAVKEQDETEKLNDHEAFVGFHNSERQPCTYEQALFGLFMGHVLSFWDRR